MPGTDEQEPDLIDLVYETINTHKEIDTRKKDLKAHNIAHQVSVSSEEQRHEEIVSSEEIGHAHALYLEDQSHEAAVGEIREQIEGLRTGQRGVMEDLIASLEQRQAQGEISISDFLLLNAVNSTDPEKARNRHAEFSYELEQIADLIRANQGQLFLYRELPPAPGRGYATHHMFWQVGRLAPVLKERGFTPPTTLMNSERGLYLWSDQEFYSPDGLFSYRVSSSLDDYFTVRFRLGTDLRVVAKERILMPQLRLHPGGLISMENEKEVRINVSRDDERQVYMFSDAPQNILEIIDRSPFDTDPALNRRQIMVFGDENVAEALSYLSKQSPNFASGVRRTVKEIKQYHDKNFQLDQQRNLAA